MKVLYFGTVCDLKTYEKKMETCRFKTSVASIVFETALLQGFSQNGLDIELHSFPMIPSFPNSRLLQFGGHSEILPCGYECRWLNTINVPIFKQLSRRIDARRVIRHWAKQVGQDGVIMTYSIPPFLVKDIIKYGKKYSMKTVAIVPDLLQNMYINHVQNGIQSLIKKMYLKPALKYQGQYDGYVYLTEAMRDMVSKQKPYMVMEGIANLDEPRLEDIKKSYPKAIMYAGRLHEKYGIIELIDAFEKLKDNDTELWLFGEGTAVSYIREKAKWNNRIKYFGNVTREEILEYERKATLLVNPRSVQDEFTQYSFPSKTIEYMHSGTPLVTTKLKGIPQEYFDYVFIAEDNDKTLLAETINKALELPEVELIEKGNQARRFIREQKNATSQSRRIITFMQNIIGE